MLRRPDLGLAVRNHPNLLGKISSAAQALGHQSPQINKNAMIKEILKSQQKQSGVKVGSSDSSSSMSGIGYILLLLSSLLLLIGWFGSWMPDNNNNNTTTTTPMPTSTSSTTEAPIADKYGCSFGFQGRLCDPCGVQTVKPDVKIVGGVDAVPHSWPFQALLAYSYAANVTIPGTNVTQMYSDTNRFICGGALITRDTVLTAAHCIDDLTSSFIVEYNSSYYWYSTVPNQYYPTLASRYSVYLGAHNKTAALNGVAPAIRVPVVYVQVHPEYNLDGKMFNDIAIIKLAYEVTLNSNIQLACLPDPSKSHYPTNYGVDTYAMGWGTTEQGGNTSDILQNVVLELLDGPTQCYPDNQDQFNWNTQVCSGILAGGKDTCQGDSGGPLYVLDTVPDQNGTDVQKYIEIGVVSYGPGCANAGYPGLYTRVSGYHKFIQEFI